jgi:hypothetical protein
MRLSEGIFIPEKISLFLFELQKRRNLFLKFTQFSTSISDDQKTEPVY